MAAQHKVYGLAGAAHFFKGGIHRSGAVYHVGDILGKLVGQLTLQGYQRAKGLGTAEQFAVHLLLQRSGSLGVCLHTAIQQFQEILKTSGAFNGCGIELYAHVGGHFRSLAAGLDQRGEYGSKLSGNLGGVAAHSSKSGEGTQKLFYRHIQCCRVACDSRQSLRQLLE